MMGDHNTETLELQSRQNDIDEKCFCDGLLGENIYLHLDDNSIPWILNHIDFFVSQTRGSESVEEVHLYPYAFNGHVDEVWDKLGQAVGNLQALKRLCISTRDRTNGHDEDEAVPIPDWERLARILSLVRQNVSVNLYGFDVWAVGDVQALARAIRGHPTITSFVDSRGMFPYESLDALYSALATLPALESIALSNRGLHAQPEDEYALAYPESLTELLRVPTLRSVHFHRFSFTRALCQATANALTEGTAFNKLVFRSCEFAAGECAAIIANGLGRNTSVTCIDVVSPLDQALYNALAMALPLNLTLRGLSFLFGSISAEHLSPVLLALGKNTGLTTLIVGASYSMDESLCTALKDGLGTNETLESLEVNNFRLCDDNADLWSRAFSFLLTNKALKSLVVDVQYSVTETCLSAFYIDIATMLQENTSLEILTVQSSNIIEIKAEEYLVLVATLQHNTTLKSLNLTGRGSLTLTGDEDKQMAALLKKNYAMESLPDIDLENEAGDVGAILRLNEAGRRYLIEYGSSISKGVKVLSAVSNEINCVFWHLLENPRLCDRSAVEAPAKDSTDNGGSTSPVNHTTGKRQHGRAQNEGKESCRRLT
jgi:hypothetical protein